MDEACEEYPKRTISSGLIVEKHYGIDSIMNKLKTHPKSGIQGTKQDLEERQRVFGPNYFPPPYIKSLWELVMENFDDRINQILAVAALVSLVIGVIQEGFPQGLIEGASIIIALTIIIVVGSGNNYISEKRLADLVKLSDKQEVAVYRNSTNTTLIDSSNLVVGDLFYFEAGMKVPADCIIVEGQDVVCIEAELTGEGDGIEKTPVTEENFNLEGTSGTMLAKSLISEGSGIALVLAVGPNTVAGIITQKTLEQGGEGSDDTLLQKKLTIMAESIGNVGMGCAVLTLASMFLRVGIEMAGLVPCGCMNIATCQEDPDCKPLSFEFSLQNRLWTDLLNTVIIAISVIVCAIPEGLPLAVTISLSYSSAEMRKENALVRRLASLETMGGASHICSDKTGTLTMNQMTVMSCAITNKVFSAETQD